MLDIDVKSLKILTSLTTERIDVDYEGGLLSIDRNHYSGHIDYEVEFEYNNMAGSEEILKKLLDDNGIPFVFNNATKVHRAMKNVHAYDPLVQEVLRPYALEGINLHHWTASLYSELAREGATKGDALAYIIDHYHLTKEDVIAFGDADNDGGMLGRL